MSKGVCECGDEVIVDERGSAYPWCGVCKEKRDAFERRIQRRRDRAMIYAGHKGKRGHWLNALRGNIPPLFAKARLSALAAPLQRKLRAIDRHRGLYLWGPVGAGKSHTLCALARYYVIQNCSVKRAKWDQLCQDIRDTYNTDLSEGNVIKPFIACDKLILEDLGTSVSPGKPESDFAVRTLLLLIDERIEHCRPTFISSNKPLEEIEKSFDQRTASRIRGNCEVIKVAGRDKRLI